MLERDTRSAIFRLAREGHGSRAIARALGISRRVVKKVMRSGEVEVPAFDRTEQLTAHLERIRELQVECKGNQVRVWEKLTAEAGVNVAYSTLTGFCRRHGIGVVPKDPVGSYEFPPGQEMQHDTSPHTVEIAGQVRLLQCASLVICYSRMLYAQLYPRWTRFECKVFLSQALQHFDGAAKRCVIDNSSVILGGGTGKHARPAPEMEAFSKRFDFQFLAHELGDADRSAKVERPFHYIENNFYAGRKFDSVADLNEQLRQWCERVNGKPKRTIGWLAPVVLFAVEKALLTPLPVYVPEVYEVHQRRADVDGFVSLHTNHYSVPAELIGRTLGIRETIERVRLFDGHRLVVEHRRQDSGARRTVLLPEHRQPRRQKRPSLPPLPEEATLRGVSATLAALLDRLRVYHGGQAARSVRQLHRMYFDYPLPALEKAVGAALEYGLIDLGRIERLVLRNVAGEFFRLPGDGKKKDDADGDQ